MKNNIYLKTFLIMAIGCLFFACKTNSQKVESSSQEADSSSQKAESSSIAAGVSRTDKVVKTTAEWQSQLTGLEYYVLRDKGTERAFTGEYWDNKEKGVYNCRACALPLFHSDTKFKSGTGWPSYYEAIEKENIIETTDHVLGYARTEILCARCDGHLGHVFPDGPEPTGLRYCLNSVSLKFEKEE